MQCFIETLLNCRVWVCIEAVMCHTMLSSMKEGLVEMVAFSFTNKLHVMVSSSLCFQFLLVFLGMLVGLISFTAAVASKAL